MTMVLQLPLQRGGGQSPIPFLAGGADCLGEEPGHSAYGDQESKNPFVPWQPLGQGPQER